MTEKFKAKVNNSLEFDIASEEVSKIDTIQTVQDSFHILQDNTSYTAQIVQSDFTNRAYAVKINNNIYEVVITNQLDQLIKDMGFSLGATKHVNSIKAPMPGLLLDLFVAVGQEVKEHDPLFILEAMKMENSILSPRDGIIKSISANKGDAIDKGQLLIEFE